MFYIYELGLVIISYLLIIVGVLISVAFLVLLERSVLGYAQIRKGPNKVGYLGVLQSFGDAVKLFIKEPLSGSAFNYLIYCAAPIISLFLSLALWLVLPYSSLVINLGLGGLFFFCCTSLGVYVLMGSGWASNSSYAMLGATRGVAQTISYEVSMALIFLGVVFFAGAYSVRVLLVLQDELWFILFFFPVFMCWVVSSLAETNRTPFDFAEGESELVSGFNIEYGAGGFALLFLAEYGSIIFMSYLVVCLFLGGASFSLFLFNLLGVFFCFWFIWVRGTMPRYRYDKLMYLAWKAFLPISLGMMFFYYGWVMVMF